MPLVNSGLGDQKAKGSAGWVLRAVGYMDEDFGHLNCLLCRKQNIVGGWTLAGENVAQERWRDFSSDIIAEIRGSEANHRMNVAIMRRYPERVTWLRQVTYGADESEAVARTISLKMRLVPPRIPRQPKSRPSLTKMCPPRFGSSVTQVLIQSIPWRP